MTDKSDIIIPARAERFDSGERMPVDKVDIGQWYWVKEIARHDEPARGRKKGEAYEWFGCVMAIGSNYVELSSVSYGKHSMRSTRRVHFDEFEDVLRFEPSPNDVIDAKIAHYRTRVNMLLGEVTELTRRLGVVPTTSIADKTSDATNALVAVTQQVDTTAYKNALIEAKEKTLPDLFKEIEDANATMANWMVAPTMAITATIGPMKNTIKGVEDRIYTLELYAGLTEDAVQIREGKPAAREEKLRLMQRRMYMDEECLANYEAGGMELKDISAFDRWLAREDNFSRLLPFERCAVAFRVRRFEKERSAETMWQSFINIFLRQEDKTTFLYVRNGDQLWRIDCNFDFGPKIVPDITEFDPSQPMMVKMFASRVDKIIPKSAWEVMRAEELELERKWQEWIDTHPTEERIHNPYGYFQPSRMEHKEYHPFDQSSVYYDEAVDEVSSSIKKYNRVAVIIQGLFDRSMVLHPHDPVRVWDPVSFANSVEVVYDATTLTHGDKPNFEAYRAKLNESFKVGSVAVGQDDVWARREAAKENERQKRDWRNRNPTTYTWYRPYGNPGPGRVAKIAELTRTGKATFKWERRRQDNSWKSDMVQCSIMVDTRSLLNIDAYKPGDFKQFFADPRTRAEYFKWAPLMLTAEDYHAGKMKKFAHEDD